MLKNQVGNYLLYLLSEKRTLRWHDFKKYVEALYGGKAQEKDKYFIYNLSRNLSSLGYIDIGEKNNQTYIKVTPPMLVALPYLTPVFLLTGACAPELLKKIKHHFQSEVKNYKYLPDTVIIKSENIEGLEDKLKNIEFQGNKLTDYIRICKTPVAWNILEFSKSLCEYKQSLTNDDWCSGNSSEIKEVFDPQTLKFKDFKSESLKGNGLSLVKISHFEQSKYYLFSKQKKEKARINLDWGKFFIANQFQKQVLSYHQKTFELSSRMRLPLILERGLTLLSGTLSKYEEKKTNLGKKLEKVFVFKNVPDKLAKLVAQKLGQKLKIGVQDNA